MSQGRDSIGGPEEETSKMRSKGGEKQSEGRLGWKE
jgi:hypothetical protein